MARIGQLINLTFRSTQITLQVDMSGAGPWTLTMLNIKTPDARLQRMRSS